MRDCSVTHQPPWVCYLLQRALPPMSSQPPPPQPPQQALILLASSWTLSPRIEMPNMCLSTFLALQAPEQVDHHLPTPFSHGCEMPFGSSTWNSHGTICDCPTLRDFCLLIYDFLLPISLLRAARILFLHQWLSQTLLDTNHPWDQLKSPLLGGHGGPSNLSLCPLLPHRGQSQQHQG